MEKKNTKGTTALVVLLLIVTIAALILATYAWAKYTSSDNGTANATIAKWNVTFNTANEVTIAQQSHVVEGKIAPGSKGTFNIVPQANDTEVCFNYEIKITSVELLGTVPANVTSSDFLTNHIVLSTGASGSETAYTLGNSINGTYDLSGHNATPGSMTGITTINWEWKYQDPANAANETWDQIDTEVGQAVAAGQITGLRFNYTVKATQVNPQNATH